MAIFLSYINNINILLKVIETHIVPENSDEIRVQEYAVSIFTSVPSRSGIKKAIKKGLILIDGKRAETSHWIKQGQKIELLQKNEASKKIFPLNMDILFEDDHIAVIHKPCGYPTSGNYFKTIENALPHNLKKSEEMDALPSPLSAHRLDNPTSGILLCAKTMKSLIGLQKAFSEKNISKTYYALVLGKIEDSLKLTAAIEGKSAVTLISPKKFFKIEEEIYTLVKANPLTGRTHQLRIHLSRNKTPIIGDKIYGLEQSYFKNKSLYLFSSEIAFSHPVTEVEMNFRIPLPKRVRNLNNYSLS